MSANDHGLVTATLTAPSALQVQRLRDARPVPVPMPTITAEEYEALQDQREALLDSAAMHSSWTVSPVVPGREQVVSSSERQTQLVADLKAYPQSVTGKLIMSLGNSTYHGSAWIIGKRAIITAGHCVYDHDARSFYNQIQFTPISDNGRSEYGPFAAIKATTLKEYVEGANGSRLVFDLGVCVLDKDLPVGLGQAGYAINRVLSPGKLLSLGYPAEPNRRFDFDGRQMWQSLGDYHMEDDAGRGSTRARNFAMFNDLTGGCSGGPIFAAEGTAIAIGLNSHVRVSRTGVPEQPPRMYSPYFGEAVKRLIAWLSENGGQPNEPGTLAPSEPKPMPSLKVRLGEIASELNALVATL